METIDRCSLISPQLGISFPQLLLAATETAGNQGDQENNNENIEENFSDTCSTGGDTGEAKYGRYERNNQECDGPA